MKTVKLPKKFLAIYPELADRVTHLRYVRDAEKKPIGVVLIDVYGYVGHSMLNVKAGDRWVVARGIRKALYRCRKKIKIGTVVDTLRGRYRDIIRHACTCDMGKHRYLDHMYRLIVTLTELVEYCQHHALTESV